MPPRPGADIAKVATDDLKPVLQRRPVGRLLVEMGALSFEDLEQPLAFQRHRGGFLGEIAVNRGLASPLILLAALKKQQALPPLRRHGRPDRGPEDVFLVRLPRTSEAVKGEDGIHSA